MNYPKIGIRPIIDGRLGGVRESLEDTTMNMAKAVAELYKNTLHYPDGTPVECVIADNTIGGVREAEDCRIKFEAANVGLTLSVTPCWAYGSETMDMHPTWPKAIWGFNGTERPGAVYLAATLAAHNQMGLPAFGIYGRDVQDLGDTVIPKDVEEKLLLFAKSGLAVAIMRGKSYLAIGSVSMGIAGSCVSPDLFRQYLGMRNEWVDSAEVLRRIEQKIYDEEEFERALKWTKEYCKEGSDYNNKPYSRDEKDHQWDTVVKMTLIIRDLMTGNPKLKDKGFGEEALGHNAIVSGFQGQRQWTDFLPNGDFSEAILNSSFDWNGLRAPFTVATENDSLNGLSMLFGQLLTHTAQIFADVRTYWSPEAVKRVTGWDPSGGMAKHGFIHLINSGSATLDGTGQQSTTNGQPCLKPFWEISEKEATDCLDATTWYPANTGYFRGGGFSSQFVTKGGMPVTMCRLNLVHGLGPVLQIAEGWTIDLPEKVHQILNERTDRTWPTTWFVPRLTGSGSFRDVYSVMAAWGANHGSISYGHIGKNLITLASMLRIPVNMHNVEEEHIFRPSAWNMFASDHDACKTYGPLYG